MIRNLKIEAGDLVLPCPFCGNSQVGEGNLELMNTHTACYWIACPCGVEVTGKCYGTDKSSEKLTLKEHQWAKTSALNNWNSRNAPQVAKSKARFAGELLGLEILKTRKARA